MWPFKRKEIALESIKEAPESISFSVFDYPKTLYKVYWEIVHTAQEHGVETEVRFLGYSDYPHTSIHRLQTPDIVSAELAAINLVKSKMSDYTR